QPEKRRFDRALDALDKALRSLPPGARVGLRAFSGKNSGEKNYSVWSMEPWGKDEIRAAPEKVKALRKKIVPQHRTPLVEAMIEAKKDYPADFRGTKVMLVLTDGGDSTFAVNDKIGLKQKVREAFRDANIHLHVIAFETEDKRFPITEIEK